MIKFSMNGFRYSWRMIKSIHNNPYLVYSKVNTGRVGRNKTLQTKKERSFAFSVYQKLKHNYQNI